MSDELRDEYHFDYRQAKPNRFAALIARDGMVTPSQPKPASSGDVAAAPGRAHADLSDEQEHLLEALYAGVPLSVDDLPYTDEMAGLHRDFVTRAGLSLPIREVYTALKNLGRQGRLGGKFRSPQG